jgi:hypothetical protein
MVIYLCLFVGARLHGPTTVDGTDAAVADQGKMEIELQPATFAGSAGTTLIAPQYAQLRYDRDMEAVLKAKYKARFLRRALQI